MVTGIGRLITNQPALGQGALGVIQDAAVVVDDGRVAWVGERAAIPDAAGDDRLDAGGRCVIPGFVDSHTHLVFGGDRADEFEARLAGAPYDGGGIPRTVAATRETPTDALAAAATQRARQALVSGTTTIEVKSGYGLTTAHERRLLEVAGGLERRDLPAVVPTFLGAHVVPSEHSVDSYVAEVVDAMLPACAPLSRWCDVFCEPTVFDADRARTVLAAGREHGLGLRLHANQLERGPGATLAAELGATSADHLTHLNDADVEALADAGVVATLLPAAEFSTRSPYAPARRLLDAGVVVAVATDCNPGTSYTTSMPFVIAVACREMRLTPDEALAAATAGGARALALRDVGHLGVGAAADLVVLDAPTHVHLAYRPAMPLVSTVVRGGRVVHQEANLG